MKVKIVGKRKPGPKKEEPPDIILADITSQASIDLSEEDFEDLHSCITFTMRQQKTGAKHFDKNLSKLDKKFWKFIREMR